MKILDANQIREADAYTIQYEPIQSIDLMERAAQQCTDWILANYDQLNKVIVFVGLGNNGGDGLAIARFLKCAGYSVVVYIIDWGAKTSADFEINKARIADLQIETHTLSSDSLNLVKSSDPILIIDAILGAGLSRTVSDFIASIIHKINDLNSTIISIDIASGLMIDQINSIANNAIIRPQHTLSIALPKLAFLMPENEIYVGQWHIMDIGTHPTYLENTKAFACLLEKDEVARRMKARSKYAHKGNFGHALLIAGSMGKMGAAILAAKASLKSGLGLLTAHIPQSAVPILQSTIPECMLSIDESELNFSFVPNLAQYNSIGIGPGIGTSSESSAALKLLIQNTIIPLVIDADAINIISENKTWLAFLPSGTILTPHPKEFDRLAGKSADSLQRIHKQIELSRKYQIFIVLKGAYTSISTPDGQLFFNATGNPGMATAGSGDVLTGIITSLVAQSYDNLSACLLGVYIHGLAGDFAAMELGFESMIASDLINNLSKAFIHLHLKLD